ncbi:hypothetical protein CkaCkLH20_03545 [Colletotrichum karsti]|uniref:Uncharacterized protein n=1 Tax=Colletotrichum karsti TaxID=1095194 RepID=A0A9P6I9G5_9PEZI|nr:uncharacterized protein CkaCkLH20_03545 [Colletotrichum karsti]KAF9879312.1 hypothetical protein CkaCkLH20_03545 [Colletotrichum karsti]
MERLEGHKHTHIPFHAGEFQHDSRYQEHRSPQWNISNESSPSIAQRRVAPNTSDGAHDSLVGNDDDIVFISHSDTVSPPPSEGAGSNGTVMNRKPTSIAPPPMLPGSAFTLTSSNITIHNLESQPSGARTIYEWMHGRRCPGDFDVKDISSKASIKVRCPSRVSHSTATHDDNYGMVNHESESFVTGAGDWAAETSLPADFRELDL